MRPTWNGSGISSVGADQGRPASATFDAKRLCSPVLPFKAAEHGSLQEWTRPISRSGTWAEVTAAELVRRASSKLDAVRAQQKRVLRQAPLVGLLLDCSACAAELAGAEGDIDYCGSDGSPGSASGLGSGDDGRLWEGRSSAEVRRLLPQSLGVSAECGLTFHGAPRRLLLLHLAEPPEGAAPAAQLSALRGLAWEAIKVLQPSPAREEETQGPLVWPIYGSRVCKVVIAMEEAMLTGLVGGAEGPVWRRILAWLRICTPMGGGPFLRLLHRQFGPSVAFAFAWKQYFTQQLWLLAVLCVVWLFVGGTPSEGFRQWVIWEVCKFVVLVWGVLVAFRWRGLPPGAFAGSGCSPAAVVPVTAAIAAAPTLDAPAQVTGEGGGPIPGSLWKLILIGAPVLVAFTTVVNLTVLGFTQLMVYEIFIWGDCAVLGCTSPQQKHGYSGLLVEISTDVLLALIFELYFALAQELAERLAALRHIPGCMDFRLSVDILVLVLASVERSGTFGALAFVFVPQWVEPPHGDTIDINGYCGDLWFGSSSVFCMQRRLPAKVRRNLLKKVMKGPFFVAPFIAMLIKVIIPLVARALDRFARNHGKDCWGPCRCVTFFVARTCALIFSYDGDHVGCLRFIFKGWPFGEPTSVRGPNGELEREDPLMAWEDIENLNTANRASSPARGVLDRAQAAVAQKFNKRVQDSPVSTRASVATVGQVDVVGQELCRKDLILRALSECARKPFEPESELLEVQMSFLWLLLFSPILPMGILPTLLSQVVKMKTDIAKMLHARRRPFPDDDSCLRSTQMAFVSAAAFGAVGWSIGLSLITYNDDLWRWPWGARAGLAVGLTLWLIAAAAVALAHADRAWLAVVSAVGVALGSSFLVFSYFVNSEIVVPH